MRARIGFLLLVVLFLNPVPSEAYSKNLDPQAVSEAIAYGTSRRDKPLLDFESPYFVRLRDPRGCWMGVAVIFTPYLQIARLVKAKGETLTETEIQDALRDSSGILLVQALVRRPTQLGKYCDLVHESPEDSTLYLDQGKQTILGHRVSGKSSPNGFELVAGFADDDLDPSGSVELVIGIPIGAALKATVNLAQLR